MYEYQNTKTFFRALIHMNSNIYIGRPIEPHTGKAANSLLRYFKILFYYITDYKSIVIGCENISKCHQRVISSWLLIKMEFDALPVFRIYLCILVTNAQEKWSFSKLKLIKSVPRSTMAQEKSSTLNIICILVTNDEATTK